MNTKNNRKGYNSYSQIGIIGWSWVFFVLIYTVARDVLAWIYLDNEGLNSVMLVIVDILTAVPYGIAVALAAKNLIALKSDSSYLYNFIKWFVISLLFWVAPWVVVAVTLELDSLSRTKSIGVFLFLGLAILTFGRYLLKGPIKNR